MNKNIREITTIRVSKSFSAYAIDSSFNSAIEGK
jgi:hypothetical protein